MKTSIFSFIFLALSTSLFGQQKTILVYNLSTGTLDSLPNIAYDETITSDQTPYFIGSYDDNTADLPQVAPTTNILPSLDSLVDTEFSLKKKVTDDFDITNYPIRTSVKTFVVENDTLRNNCSGSIISRRHVMTAAHCVVNDEDEFWSDSMLVCPIYNNAEFHPDFDCSFVRKVYFFKDRALYNGEDIAILELDEPIGEETGWLGIGFNDVDEYFDEGIYFKFSYPGMPLLLVDSTEYNGDTLYYSYGKIDPLNENNLGVEGGYGIPGESGSSFFLVQNNDTYTSYGVFSSLVDFRHSRINNWRFYSIKTIIESDIILTNMTQIDEKPIDLTLFPNPARDIFHIKNVNITNVKSAFITDYAGRIVKSVSKADLASGINISLLPNGIYRIFITTENDVFSGKIIKIGK